MGPGSNPNWPNVRAYVDFTNPGASPTTTWTEITSYCKRLQPGQLAHIERGRNYERSQTDSSILNLTIDNSTGAFDPENTSSPFYPNVKPIRKIKLEATWLGVTYSLFTGRVEDWPRVWKAAGFWGEVALTARGILSTLSAITLKSAWLNEAVLDGATGLYRLDDPSGSVTAANSSPFQENYGLVQYTPTTTNASTFAFGSTPGTDNLAGDPTNGLDLTPEIVLNSTAGYYVEMANRSKGNTGLFFPVTAWSFEVWFRFPTTVLPYAAYLMSQTSGVSGGGTEQAWMYIDPNADNHQIFAGFQDGGAGAAVNSAYLNFFDQDWHQAVLSYDPVAGGGTVYIHVDGQPVDSNFAGVVSYVTPPTVMALGTRLPNPIATGYTGCFAGSMKNATWYLSGRLTDAEILEHFLAGQGYVGDDTGTRIGRILDYVPYSLQALDVGNSILGRMNIEGVNVVQAIQNANDTEVGTIIERGDGYIAFKNRHSRNPSNADLASFGESGVAYQDDFNLKQDPAYIFTDVVVARDTGITITNADTTAELDYFPRTLNLTSYDATDDQAILLSEYLLSQYKVGRTRIPVLTIIPSAHPAYFALALSLEIGNRVAVARNNTTPGTQPITGDFYIEKITHDVSTGVWRTSFMMSSSTLWDDTFILDDNTLGVLDTSRLGF